MQGPSYSGPVVAADRIFVTETRDAEVEVIRALDRNTGRLIWEAEWDGAIKVPFFAAGNGSWIRATPAFDGGRLCVAGMRDVLVCLDAGDGSTIWKRDFVNETGSEVPSFVPAQQNVEPCRWARDYLRVSLARYPFIVFSPVAKQKASIGPLANDPTVLATSETLKLTVPLNQYRNG